MRLSRGVLFTAAALVAALVLPPSARAAAPASRVFMSTTGNDSNSCANPNTPCLTFAGALAQVAAGGEVIAEATGGYGTINITKSVTVSGPPGVVIFSGFTVTVNAGASDTVVLRGLTIDGNGTPTGNGINVTSVGNLHVESCVITGFAGTTSDGSGIYFASAGKLFVKDTIVRGNGLAGIWVAPSSGAVQASVDRCRLEQNTWGLFSDNEFGGTAQTTIKDSVAAGNVSSGLLCDGELNAEGCLVANNHLVLATIAGVLRASNCTVTDNNTGLSSGGSLLSFGNNRVAGNVTNGGFTSTILQQ